MNQKERKKIINLAFNEAKRAATEDEVPVGAVIFNSETGNIITKSHNQTEQTQNVLAHAEMLAIQKATHKLHTKFLNGYSMFVSLEPCTMCAAAIAWVRLDAVYYGATDPKTGGIRQGPKVFTRSQTHHKIKSRLITTPECGQILTHFFQTKRSPKNKYF